MTVSTAHFPAMPAAASLEQTPVVLTVLNRRRDGATSQLVLFKKNSAAADDPVLAWKVLRCPAGQEARVVVPFSQQVGVFDPRGSHAGLESASAGDCFEVADARRAGSGGAAAPLLGRTQDHLAAIGPNMVGVHNGTSDGVLDVVLYKDGRPLCRQGALAPGTTIVFEVLPYLHVGLCAGVAEGAMLDAATVAAAMRISLLGLKSADLILTGGAGEEKFNLVNQRFS
ncbi:MAG: aromatic ring-opening dioxygenase LigA [Massilia sp.]|nr:aromatic ring-opening dioxygenase LigA [Massilia sp.]